MSELKDRETRSRAEVLYCLNVLIQHITDEQVEPFLCYAEDIGEFEDQVLSALRLIRHVAMEMRTEYVKGAFA